MTQADTELGAAEQNVLEKRRALVDAIYAIHAGEGRIRVDLALAQHLGAAWRDYDAAVRGAPVAGYAEWWAEHEPREHFLDDWTHDDLRAFAERAFAAGRLSAGSA